MSVESFRAAVPSGASTGKYEAVELRDGDQRVHLGKGVSNAIEAVNRVVAPALLSSGLDLLDQKAIDGFLIQLDGTPNKAKLGANAILSISLAVARAAASVKGATLSSYLNSLLATPCEMILPTPFFNVINGGSHAGNELGFQEFMIVPTEAKSFEEAMRIGSEVYQHLKQVIKQTFGLSATNVGDEGGFAPPTETPEQALDLIIKAIKAAGYDGEVKIALDVAASGTSYHRCQLLEFCTDDKKYNMHYKSTKKPSPISGLELAEYYRKLVHNYPSTGHNSLTSIVISIEDPFDQDDFDSWAALRSSVPIQIVGDDLTVTNIERIKLANTKLACNCLLLKVNQIGTLTEAIQRYPPRLTNATSACLARQFGWKVMVSHRSGETEDSFIADLAVGIASGQIKSGAPCRSERMSKYNQLLRIERAMLSNN